MIYRLNVMDIIPGKLAEYDEIAAKEMVPIMAKYGQKLIAGWHSYSGNVNQSYSLYAYNDLAEFQKISEAQRKDPDYQRVNGKLATLRIRSSMTLLEPNAWSPMK